VFLELPAVASAMRVAQTPSRGDSPNAIRSATRSRWLGKSMVGPVLFGATIDVASQKT
jgi:hypothetical protein